jgi:hypothetical protein
MLRVRFKKSAPPVKSRQLQKALMPPKGSPTVRTIPASIFVRSAGECHSSAGLARRHAIAALITLSQETTLPDLARDQRAA